MKSTARRKAKKRAHPGIFITFEGGEGVGKTTQIAKLAQAFERAGRKVVVTREPGGSQVANRIRSLFVGSENEGIGASCRAISL